MGNIGCTSGKTATAPASSTRRPTSSYQLPASASMESSADRDLNMQTMVSTDVSETFSGSDRNVGKHLTCDSLESKHSFSRGRGYVERPVSYKQSLHTGGPTLLGRTNSAAAGIWSKLGHSHISLANAKGFSTLETASSSTASLTDEALDSAYVPSAKAAACDSQSDTATSSATPTQHVQEVPNDNFPQFSGAAQPTAGLLCTTGGFFSCCQMEVRMPL